jgi:Tol biopolymer transport system component
VITVSNCEIYKVNTDGSHHTPLTRNNVVDFDPAWSPSGTFIVFTREPFSANSELFPINADGVGETRLTNNTAVDQEPDWQPGP